MRVLVFVSEGLNIRDWSLYLPAATRSVFYHGAPAQIPALQQYALGSGIIFSEELEGAPHTIIAFWNGTPDSVDDALYRFSKTDIPLHVFLPNEHDDGFEEYIPQHIT